MIPFVISQYEYVIMFLLIVLIVQLLKRRKIFNDSHIQAFDRLVTELALPATIFASLATSSITAEWVIPVLTMFLAILACILIAWGVCRLWGIPSATTKGSIVLLSAFGSTYTFASPLISMVFGPQSEEMSLGLMIGTFAVAIPFFTLGVFIATYFGATKGEDKHPATVLRNFLATPILITFVLGLCVSVVVTYLHVPGAGIFSDVFNDFFVVIRSSLDLLVWIAIGLLVRPVKLRTLAPFLALVVAVKMIIQPALVSYGAYAAGLQVMHQQVLFVMASMPAGAIAAVLADRCGCDGGLAAVLVICTYLISLVTIPLLLFAHGGFW